MFHCVCVFSLYPRPLYVYHAFSIPAVSIPSPAHLYLHCTKVARLYLLFSYRDPHNHASPSCATRTLNPLLPLFDHMYDGGDADVIRLLSMYPVVDCTVQHL